MSAEGDQEKNSVEAVSAGYNKNWKYAVVILIILFVIGAIILGCATACVLYDMNTVENNENAVAPPVVHEVTPEEIVGLYIHSDEIPAADLARVQEMSAIELRELQIGFIPKWFGALYKLKRLTIRSCPLLTSISDIFHGLSSLESLEIYSTPIDRFPPSFERMGQLKNLHIVSPAINFTLMDFHGMQSLEELRLEQIQNLTIPDSLRYVSTLRVFLIRDCPDFISFPNVVANLTSLTFFIMENVGISSISSSASFPDSVGLLSLSNNLKLANISDGVHFPASLEILKASSTALESLPAGIMELRRLREVYMNECHRLARIPDPLKNCTSLEWLEFTYTGIRGIPEWIWEMRFLRGLNLFRCPIQKRFRIRTNYGVDFCPKIK